MALKENVEAFAVKQALGFMDKDPEKNLPKLLDWFDMFDRKDSLKTQREAVRKVVMDKDNKFYAGVHGKAAQRRGSSVYGKYAAKTETRHENLRTVRNSYPDWNGYRAKLEPGTGRMLWRYCGKRDGAVRYSPVARTSSQYPAFDPLRKKF